MYQDPINCDISYTLPVFGVSIKRPSCFLAKEELQFETNFLDYKYLQQFEMNENDTNPNLGGLETVYNSLTSHLSYTEGIRDYLRHLRAGHEIASLPENDGFPKDGTKNGEVS